MAGRKSSDTTQNQAKKQKVTKAPVSNSKPKNSSTNRNNGGARAPSTTPLSPDLSFRVNGFQPQVVTWKSPLNFSTPNPIFVTTLIGSGPSSENPTSPPQQKFVIHLAAIYTYSSTLTKIFTSPNLDSSSTLTHTITNIAPRTFGLFVNWLYFQTFEHADKGQPSAKEFARLWILGQEYGAPKLQNHAITVLEQITKQLAAHEGVGKLRGVFDLAYSPAFGNDKVGMTQLKQLAVDTVLNFSKNGLNLQGLPEGMKSDITAVLMAHFQGLPSEQRVPTRNSGGYLVDESEPIEGEDEGDENGEAETNGKHVGVKNKENVENGEGVHGAKEETATRARERNGFAGLSGTGDASMEVEQHINEVKKGGDGSETPSWKTAEDGEDRAKERNGWNRELKNGFGDDLEEVWRSKERKTGMSWDAISVDSKETPKRV